MFTKTIQSHRLIRGEEFTISPHLIVAVTDGPFADFGVKTFAVANARGKQS